MADAAEFTLSLRDQMSANAKRAASGLDQVNRSLHGVSKAAGVGTFLGTVFGHIASKALDAGAAVLRFGAEAALSFAKSVAGAVSLRETSSRAFEALRHGTAGVEQFEQIKKIALEMGTDLPETVHQFQKLAAAQFSMEESVAIFKRMQDLVKVTGTGAEGASRAMLAMTQIKAKGRLQAEELLQLQEAGLSMELVFKALEKQTGKTREEVQKLITAGKVDSGTALLAIQEAIGQKTGGKPPGVAALEMMNTTLTGMIERAKNFAGIMLDDLAKEIGPALEGLKPILEDLMKSLQSPEAKATIAAIGSGIKLIVGAVVGAWPTIKAFISGFAEGFGEAIGPLKEMAKALLGVSADGDTMKALIPLAKDLGKALGFMAVIFGVAVGASLAFFGAIGALLGMSAAVAGALFMLVAKIAAWVGSVIAKVVGLGASLLTAGTTAAANLINGLVNGITAGVQRVIATVQSLATSVSNTLSSALKMHSPSQVMMDLGLKTAAGFELGITAGTPAVGTASSGLAGGAANTNAGGSRSVNAPVNVVINVSGAGNPAQVAEAVKQSFYGELGLAFQQMAEQAAG